MKPNPRYEQCQSADRMEAILAIASVLGSVVAVWVLFTHGWLASLVTIFMSLIAFALSRVFDLLAGTLAAIGRMEEHVKSEASKSEEGPA